MEAKTATLLGRGVFAEVIMIEVKLRSSWSSGEAQIQVTGALRRGRSRD